MNKTTYLLGAGASANAIPTVKKFNVGLEQFKNYLTHIAENDKTGWDARLTKYRNDLLTLISNITDVIESSQGHETIDTLESQHYSIG